MCPKSSRAADINLSPRTVTIIGIAFLRCSPSLLFMRQSMGRSASGFAVSHEVYTTRKPGVENQERGRLFDAK